MFIHQEIFYPVWTLEIALVLGLLVIHREFHEPLPCCAAYSIASHPNGDVLVRHVDLDVISRQQLVIAHVILFHAHEGSRGVRLGIAVSTFPADRQLLTVFLQPALINQMLLVLTMLTGFVSALSMDKAIQI